MRILAIETSCDETALALVEATGGLKAPRFKILKNQVASQIKTHIPFGGVVPNLAKREHTQNLPVLLKILFSKIEVEVKGDESRPKFVFSVMPSPGTKTVATEQIKKCLPFDEIVVTSSPGLEPALWTGIAFAKDLAKASGIPVHGANHLEGHLYSFLLARKTVNLRLKVSSLKLLSKIFPAVALIVSGGHTVLLKVDSLAKWKYLGETRDDAAGEAFDKVARMLHLPYPGGPSLSKLALLGNPQAIKFPRPMINDKKFDFSFSGLKTSVLYYLRDNPDASFADVAASFQQAVVDVLTSKAMRAVREYRAKSIFLSGGVAANVALRERLKLEVKKSGCGFYVSAFKYNTDNAVMMAVAGYMQGLRKKKYPLRANGNLGI